MNNPRLRMEQCVLILINCYELLLHPGMAVMDFYDVASGEGYAEIKTRAPTLEHSFFRLRTVILSVNRERAWGVVRRGEDSLDYDGLDDNYKFPGHYRVVHRGAFLVHNCSA